MKTVTVTLPNDTQIVVEFESPVLTGTDGQISYASYVLNGFKTIEKIIKMRERAKYLLSLTGTEREKWATRGWDPTTCQIEIDGANAALSKNSAKFWIENPDTINAVRNPK